MILAHPIIGETAEDCIIRINRASLSNYPSAAATAATINQQTGINWLQTGIVFILTVHQVLKSLTF